MLLSGSEVLVYLNYLYGYCFKHHRVRVTATAACAELPDCAQVVRGVDEQIFFGMKFKCTARAKPVIKRMRAFYCTNLVGNRTLLEVTLL